MLEARANVGIATIVFYIPAIGVAGYLLFLRHGKPYTAWILLFAFSLIRLSGGVVLIFWTFYSNNIGLIISTIVLLGAGVFPLVVATLGLLRIIARVHFQGSSKLLHIGLTITRILFGIGITLVIAGGALKGQFQNSSLLGIGSDLVKAGNLVVVLIFILLIGYEIFFWKNSNYLTVNGILLLKATFAAIPFIAVRITYALLSVFDSSGLQSKWSCLYGSVNIYIMMGLVMEYIVVLIYLGVGVRIPPVKRVG